MNKMQQECKNRSQIEREICQAQDKLLRIFFKEFEEKIDTKYNDTQKIVEERQNLQETGLCGKKPSYAYNRFNDENCLIEQREVRALGGKEVVSSETQKRKIPTTNEDPILKRELNKYNFTNMIDLNRDFQFYINHPDKMHKIQRLKKRLNTKSYQKTSYNPHQIMHDFEKENLMKYNEAMPHMGISKNGRNIKKMNQNPIKTGAMDHNDRKKLLKNLF